MSVAARAGCVGVALGSCRPADLRPALFGFLALPPTPFGVAVYGMVTVGVGFGVLLVLVIYIARRTDDETGRREPQ